MLRSSLYSALAIISIGCRVIVAQDVHVEGAEATPAPTAEAERVIVTGSHIPTAEEVGPNPVEEISRDIIEKSGDRTTAELLRRLPIAGPGGVPSANNGGAPAQGASSIALRGFDASSTLVLLDGRRLAPYPQGTSDNGAVMFIDLNSIPKAGLESIEILKDSASSIYGADAVAGVVNIKLRRNYRGAELFTSYGNTLDKDAGEYTASLVFGTGDDKSNITGVLNYYHQNSIFQRDRGFSSRASFFSRDASPWNLQLSSDAVLAAGASPDKIPDQPVFFGHAPFRTNGDAPATNYVYTPFRAVGYNFNRDAGAVPDSERYGGFLSAARKICDDQLVFYGDFFYQNVNTRYDLAPTATGNFQTPGNITLAIPPRQPGPTIDGPSYQETGVPLGAFNPFNPFQQIISGGTRARLAEFGNRIIENRTDAFFSTLGFKGDKLFDGSWGYDAGFRYSEVENTSQNTLVSASRFNRIMNAADPIFDPSSAQFIGTTIPYNPFGDFRRPIPSNFLPINFALVHPKEIDISKLATVDLNVYTTSLFALPAGDVGLAFGGQFRRETLEQNPDDLQISGDLIGSGSGNVTPQAGRKTYAFYAETSIPIVSSVKPIPGIRSLEFTAAARFEQFRNNNTNVLVPKFGVRWQPFDESLTVRATWGEGFHQPSLIELFGSSIQGINADPFIHDPVTGEPAGEFPFIIRSNPNLEPEDSRSFTAGIVYTPKFLRSLTLTIDLYDIESTSRAFVPSFQNVIDRSAIGNLLPLERVERDPLSGQIILLEEAFQNAGSRKARGVDFGLSYQTETPIGTFTSVTQVTYLDSLQFAQVPGEPESELRSNGALYGSEEAPLEWKAVSGLDWAWKGFDLGTTAHCLDGFHEILNFGPQFPNNIKEHWVKQTWFFDVRASYTFQMLSTPQAVAGYAKDAGQGSSGKERQPEGSATVQMANCTWQRLLNDTTITLGCNDVFGQDPPKSAGGNNYPGFLYDPTGRFVYFSLTKKF